MSQVINLVVDALSEEEKKQLSGNITHTIRIWLSSHQLFGLKDYSIAKISSPILNVKVLFLEHCDRKSKSKLSWLMCRSWHNKVPQLTRRKKVGWGTWLIMTLPIHPFLYFIFRPCAKVIYLTSFGDSLLFFPRCVFFTKRWKRPENVNFFTKWWKG